MAYNRNPEEIIEAKRWTELGELIPAEHAIIQDYLSPEASTVEAGTGGGRIPLEMRRMGFSNLSGFDFVPASIQTAKAQDPSGTIDYQVQDATKLGYADGAFEQIVYLQHFLSYATDAERKRTMSSEAHRILTPGGVGVFSVLCFEGRKSTLLKSAIYRVYLPYLKLLRRMRKQDRPIQILPQVPMNNHFNLGSITDAGPFLYWYRVAEIEQVLTRAGFTIERVGSRRHVEEHRMVRSTAELHGEIDSQLYFVVRSSRG